MPGAPNFSALGTARHIQKPKATRSFPVRGLCYEVANIFFDRVDVSPVPSGDKAIHDGRRPPGEQILL